MSGATVARGAPPLARALPTPVLVVACAVACAAAATVLAQVGVKGLVVVMGGLAFGICLVFVRDRALFTLVVMVASFQFLFHKSIGPIDTEMLHSAMPDPEVLKQRLQRVPLGRMGTVAEIVTVVLYLASDDSSYMTGSELVIDGGALAQ